MKLVMDEKLKHRLIGLAVILSLGAIFAPAIMKKSSQRIDGNFSVNVKLPPKPIAPDVVLTDEKDMFKTIKIAKVEIPPVSEDSQLTELVKAEPVKSDSVVSTQKQEVALVEEDVKSASAPAELALNKAANTTAKKVVNFATRKTVKPVTTVALKQKPVNKVIKAPVAVKTAKVNKVIKPTRVARNNAKPAIKKEVYAVQLASFSQLTNAQVLVNRLRSKGYKASYARTPTRQGSVYKVYVGHSQHKPEVMKLKTQLVSAMQLNGFVVNTGVS